MSKNPRLSWYVLGFVTASLGLTTCGIEEFVLLNPPGQIIINNDRLFEFRKTLDNSEVYFSGFELYYKMYTTAETPAVDVFTFEDLAAKGFKRIHSSDDRPKPLIEVNANDRIDDPPSNRSNDAFKLTVDFTGTLTRLDDPYPQIVDDGTASLIDLGDVALSDPPPILFEITDIRRGVNYVESEGPVNEYKKFSEFSVNDVGKDITSAVWDDISGGSQVQIVLYAVSFGFDFVNFKVVYSEPVYLGVESRFFPYIE